MKAEPLVITKVETRKCGAGFRDFCFVKISTSGFVTSKDGTRKPLVGWSEYLEERNIGVTQVIEWMGLLVTGADPLPWGKLIAQLSANTRHIYGGIAQQAIAAIENALLDVVGKAYGVPVCALFGGPIRTKLPVYWSHCGSFRMSYNEMLHNPLTKQQTPPLRSLADVKSLAQEVKRSGYKALKTNIFLFDENGGPGTMYMPGFGGGEGSPELNLPRSLLPNLIKQMRTFREGAGNDIGIKLDLNYNFKTEGYLQIAKALTPEAMGGTGIDWLELDLYDPQALARIRDSAAMPIASLESIMGRRTLLPYLQAGSVDVCIVDPLWNGVGEAVKMANLCEVYDVNVAAHNYHGWLGTAMCAHWCAAIPNFRELEVDVDDVPWKDEITSTLPIVDGVLELPMTPGWGVEVDEEALLRHPPVNDAKSGIWSAAGVGRETKSRL